MSNRHKPPTPSLPAQSPFFILHHRLCFQPVFRFALNSLKDAFKVFPKNPPSPIQGQGVFLFFFKTLPAYDHKARRFSLPAQTALKPRPSVAPNGGQAQTKTKLKTAFLACLLPIVAPAFNPSR